MRLNGCSIWLLTGLVLGFAGGYFVSMKMGGCKATVIKCTPLRCDMRKLWAEHVWWTRGAILSIIGNTPDKQATLDRLMKNQDDIGAKFAQYYSKENGDELAKLLKAHEEAAGAYIEAAQKKEDVEAKHKAMIAAVEPVAALLGKLNPNWPEANLLELWTQHITMIGKSIDDRLKDDWTADINQWNEVFDEAMKMSDFFTDGIQKQFPGKSE